MFTNNNGKSMSQKGNISIISSDTNINGNIVSKEILEIEGKIEGDINGNIVTLRETAFVKGNIIAKTVNVKGNFSGILKTDKCFVSKDGVLNGTLEYNFLCVEEGANIEADLKRTSGSSVSSFNKKDAEKKQ